MSRWFRHYAGMMRDDKLVRVAIKSGQTVERVVWVWGAILESAAELDDEGRYEIESAEISRFLRCKASAITSIVGALTEMGRLEDGRIAKWLARQYKSDRSAPRVALHRERKRNSGNGDETLHETLPKRHRNAPETETETDVPLSNDNGAEPEKLDEDARFWADAKAYLTRRGVKNPGALVGKWVRDHGQKETASALTEAQLERPADVVPFVEGCFRKTNGHHQPVVPL
jgi:hypothetical protein